MDVNAYATFLTDGFVALKERYETILLANQATLSITWWNRWPSSIQSRWLITHANLGYFEWAVGNFSLATRNFQEKTLRYVDFNK